MMAKRRLDGETPKNTAESRLRVIMIAREIPIMRKSAACAALLLLKTVFGFAARSLT